MRTLNGPMFRALGPMIAMASGALVGAFALNAIVKLATTTPHVGDIVAFSASTAAPFDDGTRLLVHRQDQYGCVLDLNVLRRAGGSLIVETQPDAGASGFRVHWAGARTSDDPANCGSDADLIVGRLDLDVLSLSAGGYGIGQKQATPFVTSDVDVAN